MERMRPSAERIVKISDYEDEAFYLQLRQLPPELARRCIVEIEDGNLTDDEAIQLIERKIAGRVEAVTETSFSDPGFKEFAENYDGDLLVHIENELFNDTEQQIGHGNTAKVHELDTKGEFDPVAVKYLIKPQAGTVSARVEHNIVLEVERINKLEEKLEGSGHQMNRIRVPHPYFHHATDKVQCYGMEKINGVNIEAATAGIIPPELQEKLEALDFGNVDLKEIDKEIDDFLPQFTLTVCMGQSKQTI